MTPVDLHTLQQYADHILSALRTFDVTAHALFSTMRRTGLRFEDAHNITRWTDNHNGTFSVETAKHSAIRTIPYADVSDLHLQRLQSNHPYVFPYSYASYLRYFTMFSPAPFLLCKSKPIKTHLFRHIRARELKAAGHTDAEIQQYLGEQQITSAQQYIYSIIHDPER
jgi:integrase